MKRSLGALFAYFKVLARPSTFPAGSSTRRLPRDGARAPSSRMRRNSVALPEPAPLDARSPSLRTLNAVKHHLLFRHFVSRHLRQSIFNPSRDGLSTHYRSFSLDQIHAIFCPHHHDPRRVHLQMQLHELLVGLINLDSRASLRIPRLHGHPKRTENQSSHHNGCSSETQHSPLPAPCAGAKSI